MPNIQLQLRRATKNEWYISNPILSDGEIGVETDTSQFKVGNGVSRWNQLTYGGGQGNIGPTGNTGSTGAPGTAVNTGATGPTGIAGANGVSSGVFLFLSTYNGTNGVLLPIPDNGSQIVINSGVQPANNAYLIATFSTLLNTLNSTLIVGGMWNLNLFAISTNVTTNVGFYFNVFYTNSDGSNKTVIAQGSYLSPTIVTGQNAYNKSMYVPNTILPSITCLVGIDIYAVFRGNSDSISIELRGNTVSYVSTTLLANTGTGPTGPMGPTGFLNGTVNTSIIPALDNTYDLGATGFSFRSIYVAANTMYLGNCTISADPSGNVVFTNKSGKFFVRI
jgi:hypothetical protein